MLTFYSSRQRAPIKLDGDATSMPDDIDWIDAFQPDESEIAFLERCLEVKLPTRADLVEVEASSRMSVAGDAVFLSMPATMRDADGAPVLTPIGFIVTKDRTTTIRFARLAAFEQLAARSNQEGTPSSGGPGATISILETVVDHLADVLERAGNGLDAVSHRIFQGARNRGKGSAPRRSNRVLGDMLSAIGQEAELTSKVSESLLVLSRIAPFLAANALPPVAPELRVRLDTIVADAKSLREFQDHLSNKTAFLLDALLGLSNIETNNVFRLLTLVSVIAIPPTFFASMYGMNFKYMPELEWAHGYAFGLVVIACGGILPAIWFKVKGWW